MIDRLGSYLASRPRRGAVIVLTLAVAFILVLAGLVLDLSHFGRAPYPSQELGFSLINDNVLFTQGPTMHWLNSTSNTTVESQPYIGAKYAFGILTVSWGGGNTFGDEPQLSAHTGAPSTWNREVYVSPSITMELTDLTSNGAFDEGDTILFKMVPLQEDTVFTLGLAFFPAGGGYSQHAAKVWSEYSFAVHDGKLYSWWSHNLPIEKPWFAPET